MGAWDGFSEEWRRGDTHRFPVTVTKKDAAGVAQVENISAYTKFWFTAKRHWTDDDGDAVFVKTSGGGGITITDGPNGLLQVEVDAADTSGLAKRRHRFYADIQATDASGKPWTLASGIVTINPDVQHGTS